MLSTEVELPHLEPGQEGTIMVTFVAPQDIGEYYRLVTIIRECMDFFCTRVNITTTWSVM